MAGLATTAPTSRALTVVQGQRKRVLLHTPQAKDRLLIVGNDQGSYLWRWRDLLRARQEE